VEATSRKIIEGKTPHTNVAAGVKQTRRRIQSVERALSLIELLADAKNGVRLNDISEILGLNVSTCHHLLGTLMDRGYVAQSGKDRVYYIGNKVMELSGSRVRQFDLADVVMEDLHDLNHRTGETVHLAVLQGDQLATIAVLDSRHAVRVVSAPSGKADAIHATATGKAILAWLPETEVDRLVSRSGMTVFTDKTITDREVLIEELRLVRRNGYSMDQEEYQPGVVCVGSAIRDHAGAVIGSFSCSMPTMRGSKKRMREIQADVKSTARVISEKMDGGVSAITDAPPSTALQTSRHKR